jgi:DNA-binding CsgD family transcriptional regulator
MNLALAGQEIAAHAPIVSHGGLAELFRAGCAEAGAASYLVADMVPAADRLSPRIVASNFTYDAIQAIGLDALLLLAESAVGTGLGEAPRGWHPTALAVLLECPRLSALAALGREEVFVLRLRTAGRRCIAICAGRHGGAVDAGALARLQMRACYALSCMDAPAAADDPLSERERECLAWVSQGKTTDEVALILEVSSNTVNSYVAHAIHKLGATNRAMAIATAIRRGII